MKTLLNKKSLFAALVLAGSFFVNSAAAQLIMVGGNVPNGTYEQSAFGAFAYTTCTLSAYGTPAWSSQSMPASLSGGQSVTWGYTDGTAGSTALGGTAGTNQFKLANGSFRNVIRGANNNGGVASSLQCATVAGNGKTFVDVMIWGPTLNNYGVSGATNIAWDIRDINNNVVASGTGEATVRVYFSGTAALTTKIWPTDANELGSAMVHYTVY